MKGVGARGAAALVLIAAGVVFGVAAVITAYVGSTLLDSDQAAARTAAAITQPEVSRLIATTIVDQAVEVVPDVEKARPVLVPLLTRAIADVVEAPELREIVEAVIGDVHAALFSGDTTTVTVKLSDLVVFVREQAAVLAPELGELIPDDLDDTLIDVRSDPRLVRLLQVTEAFRILPVILLLLALACLAGAVAAARDRRRAWNWAGAGVICVGGIVLAAYAGSTWLLVSQFEEGAARDAAGAAWRVFASDLGDWAVIVAGSGAVLVLSGWWASGPADLGERLGRFRRLLAPPAGPVPRLAWVAAWVAIGVYMIVAWESALWTLLRVTVTLGGVVLVAGALAEMVRLVDGRFGRVGPGSDEGS